MYLALYSRFLFNFEELSFAADFFRFADKLINGKIMIKPFKLRERVILWHRLLKAADAR